MAALGAGAAQAQNSDLGLLLGLSVTHSSVSGGGARTVFTKVHGGGQINYAVQLHETVAGRLYLELPLVVAGGIRSTVAPGAVTSSVGNTIFFTPGVRWKFSPASRVSFYAAAGGGIASFSGVFSEVSSGSVTNGVGRRTAGAVGLGGGVDLRLTRLVSFRAEYRDQITRRSLDGATHHSLVMFGVGLHF
jgi:hypothetical protein